MNRLVLAAAAVTSLMAFNLPAQQNLIRNGNFLDTSSNIWQFNTNGANATRSYQSMQNNNGTIVSRKCKIEIIQTANSEDAPQLSQSNINLEEGEGYTLSFIASSSRAGTIRAIVRSNNLVLTDSAGSVLKTSATPQKLTVNFFAEKLSGSATLLINMGGFDGPTNIALDSISMVKNSIPVIRVATPSSKDRWISGTENKIVWTNSGKLDNVKIQYSTDNGATWKIITPAATNQKSFWWKIPDSVFSDTSKILVSSVDGKIADTSDAFKIQQASAVEKGELVKNGEFLDSAYWVFNAYSPARARGNVQNEQYIIRIDTIGTEAWQAQLEQRNLTISSGKTYKLQFDAYSSRQRNIQINLGEQDSPYRSAIGGPQLIPLRTTKETHVFHFYIDPLSLDAGIRLNEIRLEFNAGNDDGTVYLDNVSLIEVEGGKTLITRPYSGSVIKAGSEFNIQWTNEPTQFIDLEYSPDSGLTWNKIADSIANLQAFLWNVPSQSSKKSIIRIKNAENDSVIGVSAIFEINKFGVPVKKGELITNGSFSRGSANWHTQFTGARGGAEVNSDGVYVVNIETPGDSLNSIVLTQGEINVPGKTAHILSFDAFANGTRDIRVKVIGDDSLIFLDTTFTLPTILSKIKLNLTTTEDAVARVEFHIGGSRASVSIDNVSFHDASWTGIISRKYASLKDQRMAGLAILGSSNGRVLFSAGKNVQGRIAIYNLNGSLIRMLNITEKVLWDGKDARGLNVSRGTYIARMNSNLGNQVNKFILK